MIGNLSLSFWYDKKKLCKLDNILLFIFLFALIISVIDLNCLIKISQVNFFIFFKFDQRMEAGFEMIYQSGSSL